MYMYLPTCCDELVCLSEWFFLAASSYCSLVLGGGSWAWSIGNWAWSKGGWSSMATGVDEGGGSSFTAVSRLGTSWCC